MCMTTGDFIKNFHVLFYNRKFKEAISLMHNFLDGKYPGVSIDYNYVIFALMKLYQETNQAIEEIKMLEKYYKKIDSQDPLFKIFNTRLEELKNESSG